MYLGCLQTPVEVCPQYNKCTEIKMSEIVTIFSIIILKEWEILHFFIINPTIPLNKCGIFLGMLG